MLRLSTSPVLRAHRVLRASLRVHTCVPALLASTIVALSLLAVAPAASAGERIVEIWNPPEARHFEPGKGAHLIGKTATPPHHRKVLAHRNAPAPHSHQTAQQSPQPGSSQTSTQGSLHQPASEAAHRSTAPVVDVGRLKHNEVPPPKHDVSHFEDIPRIVTPEGNVLRVGTDGATAQVAR
jgi:hypothetical protein